MTGTDADLPLRVSTLELFFDLVFVFAITQLTGILARDMTPTSVIRVLLIFGVLWWMYGGYVWLSNAKTPSRTPERLLLLVGMAGRALVGVFRRRRRRARRAGDDAGGSGRPSRARAGRPISTPTSRCCSGSSRWPRA